MRTSALLLATLLPTQALAAGYYFPDAGIVAMGQGGAFVASGDTQFAQYYNPATLIHIDRPTLNLGMSGVQQRVHFHRYDAETGEFLEPVDNQGGMFAVPQAGFVTPLTDDLVFAFGFTSPFAPSNLYPEDGAQRYTMIDSLIWNFAIGPSAAWRPIPQLTVGLGLQWNVLRVEQRLRVTTSGFDDPRGDVAVDARVWDRFTPGFNAGLLLVPHEAVSIGLAVQPPLSYNARGQGELDFAGHALESRMEKTVWDDDDVGLDLQMPLVLRSGVAVRPTPRLQVEAAFIFEAWSSLADIEVKDVDVTVVTDFGDQEVEERLSLPAGFADAFSIRLGGSYRVHDLVSVRAGGFYETSALPPERVSVALVDTPKFQVGTGASFFVPGDRLVFDLSSSFIFYQSLQIRNSEVRQINVYGGSERVVGDGDLSSSGLAIGGQVRVLFGGGS